MDIRLVRLRNQQLLDPVLETAAEVVQRLGAVQAQDYAGARWAVAQRTRGLTGAAVDEALAQGTILRTHLLRPTWHLVTPADLAWMLPLTAPRIKAQVAYGNRESGLDDATIVRSNRVLAGALRGGRRLTRVQLGEVLRRAGVEPRDGIRLGRLMLAAELDGVVCSGGLRDRQHTYALLAERVTDSDAIDRAAALARLATRYLAGHGPATVRDFAWWSGLPVGEAGAAVGAVQGELEAHELEGRTYWIGRQAATVITRTSPVAHLIPNFDEYTVGYSDRSMLVADDTRHLLPRPDIIACNVVIVDGRVVGTWKRSAQAGATPVALRLFAPLARPADAAIAAASERYAAFLAQPAS